MNKEVEKATIEKGDTVEINQDIYQVNPGEKYTILEKLKNDNGYYFQLAKKGETAVAMQIVESAVKLVKKAPKIEPKDAKK